MKQYNVTLRAKYGQNIGEMRIEVDRIAEVSEFICDGNQRGTLVKVRDMNGEMKIGCAVLAPGDKHNRVLAISHAVNRLGFPQQIADDLVAQIVLQDFEAMIQIMREVTDELARRLTEVFAALQEAIEFVVEVVFDTLSCLGEAVMTVKVFHSPDFKITAVQVEIGPAGV